MEAEEEQLAASKVAAASAAATAKDASAAAPAVAMPPAAVTRAPVSSAPAHLRIKFQYYQSYEKVTVAVLEKGLKEGEVDVDVEARRLTVRRKNDGALLFDKVLYEEVLPEKRKTRYMASKVRGGGRGAVGLYCRLKVRQGNADGCRGHNKNPVKCSL